MESLQVYPNPRWLCRHENYSVSLNFLKGFGFGFMAGNHA